MRYPRRTAAFIFSFFSFFSLFPRTRSVLYHFFISSVFIFTLFYFGCCFFFLHCDFFSFCFPYATLVPGAPPQNVTGEAVGPTSIFLQWEPPPPNRTNGQITYYKVFKVKATRNDSEADVITVTNGTSVRLDELKRWTEYRIWILAGTTVGDGPTSNPILVKTHEDGTLDVFLIVICFWREFLLGTLLSSIFVPSPYRWRVVASLGYVWSSVLSIFCFSKDGQWFEVSRGRSGIPMRTINVLLPVWGLRNKRQLWAGGVHTKSAGTILYTSCKNEDLFAEFVAYK